jgi:hypothetical protein
MATSPQYGWAEPDNSSLVKNGAADIRTLGDAIDTSVWNVGYGQAGKNKIINGDFGINQRGFTSTTTNNTYGFDRWRFLYNTGTITYSAQTFTAGAAPVAGYEGINFARLVTSGQSASDAYAFLLQPIEDVRTFANQTVTVSFWAKANTGTPKIAVELEQNFGSGGGASASVQTYAGQTTLSTSWARYSATATIPSLTGKTITTASYLSLNLWTSGGTAFNSRTGSLGIQSNTFDFWGVQVEYGSKATPFQTASGGSPQAEFAMCQRYYAKSYENSVTVPTNSAAGGLNFASAGATVASTAYLTNVRLPVTMRTAPTVTIYSFTSSQTGRVSDGSGTDLAAGSGGTNLIANQIFTVQNTSGGSITSAQGGFVFHYAASAEL